MFALRKPAAETAKGATKAVGGDLSAAIARINRAPAAHDPEAAKRGPGVAGACEQALAVLADAQEVLASAAASVRQAAQHVIEAASADDAERALLAERYDDARRAVEGALGTATEGALSLLSPGAERLSVHLKGAVYAVSPFPLSVDEFGLDLPPPQHGFVSHAEVADTLRRVEIALERIGRARAVYDEDASFLRRRAAQG